MSNRNPVEGKSLKHIFFNLTKENPAFYLPEERDENQQEDSERLDNESGIQQEDLDQEANVGIYQF